MNARDTLASLALLSFLAVDLSPAVAQQYPGRTVQIYVGTTAGGAVDAVARALAEDFGRALDGTFVVVNKEGRNNTIAATQVAIVLFRPTLLTTTNVPSK